LFDDETAPGEIGLRLKAVQGTLAGAFGVMIVTLTIASALGYVFSIVMTRMLGKAGAFSNFNSLNSLFLILSVSSSSVQTFVTKTIAEFEAKGERDRIKPIVHKFSRWLIWSGAIIVLVSFAVAWPLAHLMKLSSPLAVAIVATYLAVTLYLMLPYGILQGQQRFVGLGVAGISGAALRILIGVTLVAVGLGVLGALGAGTLAALCVVVAIVYYYRDYFLGKAEPIEDFHPAKTLMPLVPVAISVFLIVFMTQIDVVMIKALKGPIEADLYSYGALAGKAVLFFPAGIYMVMFPKVTALREQGKPTKGLLGKSLAVCVALEVAVVGFYALFPGFTSTFFSGKHGKAVASLTGVMGVPFVVLFGFVMALFALVNLLVFYHLALNRKAFIGLLAAGAVVEVVGIALFHDTLPGVLLVMLAVSATLLVANLLIAFGGRDRGGPVPEAVDLAEMGGTL
jgi:O-antigen/teichoic acid export membrane protein